MHKLKFVKFDLSIAISTTTTKTNWINNLKVFKATDKETNKTVAIKIQSYEGELKSLIDDEYKILRDKSDHHNLLGFFGVYRKKVAGKSEQVWFILEVSTFRLMRVKMKIRNTLPR